MATVTACLGRHHVVHFDDDPLAGACRNTDLQVDFITGATIGDRVVMRYRTGMGYGLWFGKTIEQENREMAEKKQNRPEAASSHDAVENDLTGESVGEVTKDEKQEEAPAKTFPSVRGESQCLENCKRVNAENPGAVATSIPGMYESIGIMLNNKRGSQAYHSALHNIQILWETATGKKAGVVE